MQKASCGQIVSLWEFLCAQKMNLTAVREVGEVMERHIEDSLAIVPAICGSYSSRFDTSNGNVQLVDVGSGAGLPGIVLAIARPGKEFILDLSHGHGSIDYCL